VGVYNAAMSETIILPPGGGRAYEIGAMRVEAPAGTFLRIPAGVTHDFENRDDSRAVAFNVFVPGHHFEARFAEWAS
jgi:hypothetical protein